MFAQNCYYMYFLIYQFWVLKRTVSLRPKSQQTICLFDLVLYVPVNNLLVISGWVFLCWTSTISKDLCVLLKDTTQWRRWGSNPRPFGLESRTLPLSHCNEWLASMQRVNLAYGRNMSSHDIAFTCVCNIFTARWKIDIPGFKFPRKLQERGFPKHLLIAARKHSPDQKTFVVLKATRN